MTSPGYRPKSGHQSSLSVTGETMQSITPPYQAKKTYKYRKVANSGSVDETLFTSKRYDYLQSLNSSSNARSTSTGGGGWFVHGESNSTSDQSKQRSISTPPIKSSLIKVGRATRTRSRAYKSTPTYVDETLFGPRLEEPKFPAPWEKSEDKKKGPILTWSPPVVGSLSCTPRSTPPSRPSSAAGSRPGSAKGSQLGSASGGRQSSRSVTPNKPVWK